MGEHILTAAIRSDGVIVTVERPGRHGACINFLHHHGCEYREEQGFLTSEGRFVDRREAWVIAGCAGQIINRYRPTSGILFSEDLWDEPQAALRQAEGEGR